MRQVDQALVDEISKSVVHRKGDQPPQEFDHLIGRRVMVTGAGGSIGLELVHQILDAKPSHLSLVELGEYNLYEAERQVRNWAPNVSMSPLLADIRSEAILEKTFEQERPEVVYHTAALKHVPLLEQGHNMIEAVRTNILGTKNVADNCARIGVQEMVLVSTDKAVNPTSIMGLTKRCAELYVQKMAEAETNTRFITVRFGNVIGSSGSVVPLFIEQALMGGPITITHPDIVRYFITIAEAVDLVLKASRLGLNETAEKGAIFTFDMGNPINIVELAQQVCKAVGKTLGENVELKVVGLRPGEKLIEELAYTSEDVAPTNVPGINCAVPRKRSTISADWLSLLCAYTRGRLSDSILALLKDLVPEYRADELAEAA